MTLQRSNLHKAQNTTAAAVIVLVAPEEQRAKVARCYAIFRDYRHCCDRKMGSACLKETSQTLLGTAEVTAGEERAE